MVIHYLKLRGVFPHYFPRVVFLTALCCINLSAYTFLRISHFDNVTIILANTREQSIIGRENGLNGL